MVAWASCNASSSAKSSSSDQAGSHAFICKRSAPCPCESTMNNANSGSSKLQICMRVKTPDKECLPCGKTAGIWQEWNGRDWINAPTAKCRNTWHGWGLEKLDRTRIKYSPSSPNGAF